MNFTFDTRKTQISTSLTIWSFPLVRYADLLAQAFFYLFIISLVVFGISFLGFPLSLFIIKLPVILFLLFILFLEVSLFSELVIKKPRLSLKLSDALIAPENYNLVEFLSLETCSIVQRAIKLCKSKRLSEVPSEALLYVAIAQSPDIQLLISRLGLDIKKLKQDLKNFLEKQQRAQQFKLLLSESFQKAILESAKISNERQLTAISEKELFVALAKEDDFFKKLLVDNELKEKDVENLAFWLETLESAIASRAKFWTKENLSRHASLGKEWASGFTITLDRFSIDWTKKSRNAVFNEIIGHEHEIQEVETVLSKSSLRNVLIVGSEGSGRKSIVNAIAQRACIDSSLPELNGKRLVELDMVSLLAKIQDQEKVEFLLNEIFKEAVVAGNVILVIENLENFVGHLAPRPGTIDITGILATYLAMPHFQFIGITSFDGLHRHLESNPSFLEYFRKVEVVEVSEFETTRILQNMAMSLEKEQGVFIVYPAIREIVNLTARYMPSDPLPKKAIDVLQEAVSYVKSIRQKVMLPHHIAKIISDKTQIPVGKMEFKEKAVLLNLEKLIHERIVGQKEAVNEIAIAMRRARSGISNKKRPMGVFLFLGPTGVGKTETAKALAQIYFGGEDKMIRLDMSEFQSVADIPRLLGSVGQVEQPGILTTAVRENPFSLVLLDEIEKAHKDILNLFLQVFDDGYINDGQGRKVIFSSTIIIATSNAGAPEIFKSVEAGAIIGKDTLLAGLFERAIFKPEFINRFDATIIFHPLTRENLLDIATLMFASLAKSLKEKEIEMVVSDALKQKIVELSYKPQFGARQMRRVMQDTIESKIAEALLQDKIVKGDKIEINPDNFEVVVIK